MKCLLFSGGLVLFLSQLFLSGSTVESVAVATPLAPGWGYQAARFSLRGGGDEEEEEDDDDEEEAAVEVPKDDEIVENDEEDEDEKEMEESPKKEALHLDAALAAAALKSASKAKLSQQASIKKTVSAQLSKKTTKRRILPRIPYILRATLNPFTLLAMTKSYWASLFNLNYLQQKSAAAGQELRSAVEEQAKRSPPPSSFSKRKRSMKRGQTKTLNDLPKLNT